MPPILLGTHEPFGYSEGEPYRVPFTLDPAQHTYVIGASGLGKTHLLRNILIQMIARGDDVGFLDPEWPKNSCGLAMVVLEQPAEPFSASYWPFGLLVCMNRRKQDHIAFTLMRAFFMRMHHIGIQDVAQSVLPAQNEAR